jgi:protein-S-isoprenylcysteine O-methyltransferase Ste14
VIAKGKASLTFIQGDRGKGMGLIDTWIDFFYRTATGSRKWRNILSPVGALFFFLFVALPIFLSLALDRLLGLPRLLPGMLNLILSLPLFILGSFMVGWSIYHFLEVKGTPVPFNPPPELVRSGPYAYVRNPMLSGVFLLLFAIGLSLGSISLVFIFTPLFIGFNVWELKVIEEPELGRRLGRPYLDYKNETPMFIPKFGSRKE